MDIISIDGNILYQGKEKTIKKALEAAHAWETLLERAFLKKAALRRVQVDDIGLRGANLWGADLTGADLSGADLRGCDLRAVNFKDTCLAGADLSGSDCSGAYFTGAIVEGCRMDNVRLTCPSFFTLDLPGLSSFARAVYSHRGEIDIPLNDLPLIIKRGGLPMIIVGDVFIYGAQTGPVDRIPADIKSNFCCVAETMDCVR